MSIEPTTGPQEITPLGPGLGYKVQLIIADGHIIDLGIVDNMEDAVGKLNRAKEGVGQYD